MKYTLSPKFTIIIPTYNSGKTIESALESIVTQNYDSWELWIIDNKSIDGTLSIIDKYIKKYCCIHYISEPDRGIYDAMNKGIVYSRGEWLYFLGADDKLYNIEVLKQVDKAINSTSDSIIYGNVIFRGQNKWNLNNLIFDGPYDLPKILLKNICHQALFYNRKVFKAIGNFNINYVTSADHDFNMRCFAKLPFRYVDLIIAEFYIGGQSTYIIDSKFHNDRGVLLWEYFGWQIFNTNFLGLRLYIQQAALSSQSTLNLLERIVCLIAYCKLKTQSLFERE